MNRALIIAAVVMVLGVVAAVGALIAVGGGIPYPDGPNQGYATPEGWRRSFEPYAAAVMLGGGVAALVAAGVLVAAFVRSYQAK
jgi:hypothetical protein